MLPVVVEVTQTFLHLLYMMWLMRVFSGGTARVLSAFGPKTVSVRSSEWRKDCETKSQEFL